MLVRISNDAKKNLRRAPKNVANKLRTWVEQVQIDGLQAARQCKGFNDEALRGQLKGKRSIRLSKQWRAIYIVEKSDIEFIHDAVKPRPQRV